MWLVLRDAMSTEPIAPPSSAPWEPPVIVAPGVRDGVTPAYRVRPRSWPILFSACFSLHFATMYAHVAEYTRGRNDTGRQISFVTRDETSLATFPKYKRKLCSLKELLRRLTARGDKSE